MIGLMKPVSGDGVVAIRIGCENAGDGFCVSKKMVSETGLGGVTVRVCPTARPAMPRKAATKHFILDPIPK
jgi:hypothetical protein